MMGDIRRSKREGTNFCTSSPHLWRAGGVEMISEFVGVLYEAIILKYCQMIVVHIGRGHVPKATKIHT